MQVTRLVGFVLPLVMLATAALAQVEPANPPPPVPQDAPPDAPPPQISEATPQAKAPTSRPLPKMQLSDVRRGAFVPGRPPRARWTRDGRFLEMRVDGKSIWLDPQTGDEKTERPARAPGAANPARRPRGRLSVWQKEIFFDKKPPRRSPRPSKEAVQLTKDGVPKAVPQFSPDRQRISFVRDGNLVIFGRDGSDEWQVTKGGNRKLLHGQLDWVYQEEIYGRGNYRGHWWSPDGRYVAFLKLDESKVKDFTVINHVPRGALKRERSVIAEVTSYPKVGDPNPTVQIGIVDTKERAVCYVDLKGDKPDILIVRVGFAPKGDRMWFMVQDRIQTWVELRVVDLQAGLSTESKTWIREESKVWAPRPDAPRWLSDGSFLWMSPRSGYRHVYHYRADGVLKRRVTHGEWKVSRIVRLDEQRKLLWFNGTHYGAIDQHLYRVALDGSGYRCLTFEKGRHVTSLNHDGSFFVDTWSEMNRPPVVLLRDGNGKPVRRIGVAAAPKSEFPVLPVQRLSIPARDGYEIDGSVILPPGHKKGRLYPVFMPTYSGPDAPSVREGYAVSASPGYAFLQFMAHQGCVVLRVNVRSASRRGLAHIGVCYKQLGVQELMDLEDSADYATEAFGGDPERIAISGSSYGGFIAAYAMTHSEKFCLGLADAGVYDWRLYDTIYTERYMQTPTLNPDGYRKTSVIEAAKNLRGHLLITHGTMDDNVHLQNALQLAYALQRAGKQNFEMMLYPRSRHGVGRELRKHHRTLQWRTLKKHLRLPAL